MQLWTTWAVDKSKSGLFSMALVSVSNSKRSAQNKFESIFGMHAEGCLSEKGIVRNDVTNHVFSDSVFNFLIANRENALLLVFASVYSAPAEKTL